MTKLRGPLVIFAGVVLAVVGFTTPASATVLWPNEDNMLGANPYRYSYIFDPGSGAITQEQFASPQLTDFYTGHGFDKNFMYWAPIVAIDPPNEIWNGCDDNGGGLCPEANIHSGVQTVAAEVASGQVHVKLWNGAFIGDACGNWNHSGAGPVPTISGTKYEDLNGDGAREAGEPGLAGWQIDLVYDGTVVATTTTGTDGGYRFALDADRLPIRAGTYAVAEHSQPGWVQSHAPDAVPIGYGVADKNFAGRDFGNYRPATVEGRKFDDHGADGSGTGDPGIADWTITLSNGASATTRTDGNYGFGGLRPGTYTVQEQARDGWRQTAPGTGTRTVTVTSGQVVDGADFGNVCLGVISVTAPDGVATRVDEVTVPGILTNDPPVPRTASGTATIANLLPGTYRVTLTLPDGVFTTDPDLTSINGSFAIVKTVTVPECGAATITPVFVTSQPGKITGGVRILVPGGFATAGFEFMQRTDGPRGTLEFNDHASGIRLHTSDITGISVSGTDAYIFGHATVGDAVYSFRLHLVDAGEPGSADRFELILANGYTAGFAETLDGGNVQIH
ncbi:SdrD B-like domain-containing protein [Labedaea rhizosphaerae]|nr:SdrD B-like domain-containing protein [Labedaea rhizosphaerae]